MTSEEEQGRTDRSENNPPHVVLEQNDTQGTCSQEHNDRTLQDAILTRDLCKRKEKEIDLKEMNSESHEKDLLHEIAILRRELDTVKNHNQEMESILRTLQF